MSEQFPCPHCGKTLSHAPEYAGVPLACPYCNQTFVMANDGTTAGNGTPTPTPLTGLPPMAPTQRPGSVTTVAVIGIILAALGLLGTTCLGFLLLAFFLVPEAAEKLNAAMAQQSIASAYLLFDAIKTFVLSLALLVLSITLLKRHEYARRWFQVLALVNIVSVALGIVQAAQGDQVTEFAGAACSSIPVMAYYIFSLICVRGQRARTWFAARPNTTPPQAPMLNGT